MVGSNRLHHTILLNFKLSEIPYTKTHVVKHFYS